MTDEERRVALANAFAAQARSDWQLYQHLASQGFPICHALQHLQMATEKIAKAYRIRDTAADPDELAKHHTGFVAFVSEFFRTKTVRDEYRGKGAVLAQLQKNVEALAREIERLAPAIDHLTTPENAEYPWERDQRVYAPCAFGYPNLDLLRTAGGRATMKMIARAFEDYETLTLQ
jgi:uncharacterized protein YukE